MKGYSQVDIGLLRTVIECYDNYYDVYVEHLKQTRRDAMASYAKRHIGKRFFWLWFGIVPCNEARAKKWAIERFDRWYPIDHYSEELGWQNSRCSAEHNIDFLKNYMRSQHDYIVGLVTRCVNENNIMLEITEVQQLHRFIEVYTRTQKPEFPISFKK